MIFKELDKRVPKVSVIMGVYNCGDTLQEALDSLYNQTFQDFEIILCDDGSTDNTFQIAEENKLRFPNKIKLIRNPKNLGLNETLNRCLEIAQGNYIARMDGDDRSLPERFQKEVDFLDSHPEYSIVSAPAIRFDERGVFARGKGCREVTKEHFIKGTPFCHPACMVRMEAYDKVEGYTVDKKLLRVEDYHLWFKMYAAGLKGYNLEEPVYEHRDSMTRSKRRLRYRLNEFHVRRYGYELLNIPINKRFYIFRPIIIAIVPFFLYKYLHKRSNRQSIN